MDSALVNGIIEAGKGLTDSFANIDASLFAAVLGVLGTLLGTILGWLLNSFSQRGKLNVFVTAWNDSFQYNNNYGDIVPCHNMSQAEYYSCNLSLDVYNSSAETRIMRNLEIVFAKDKTEILACTPDDCTTQRFSAGCTRYQKVGPINIPPKCVITVDLRYGEWDKDDSCMKYWNINNIFLRYTDKKNKLKKITICRKNYANYFLNDPEEDSLEKE